MEGSRGMEWYLIGGVDGGEMSRLVRSKLWGHGADGGSDGFVSEDATDEDEDRGVRSGRFAIGTCSYQ